MMYNIYIVHHFIEGYMPSIAFLAGTKPQIHILGGGTFSRVRNHLSLAAEAFGETAICLTDLFRDVADKKQWEVYEHLTKMASPRTSNLVTNEDVSSFLDQLIANPLTKVIILNIAFCDYNGQIGSVKSGKYSQRLKTRSGDQIMSLSVADKLIKKVRQTRKDIFLVAFKTTCLETETAQYIAGLDLLKENSANIVFANDTGNHRNMIIVPEEAKYCITENRITALRALVDITMKRCNLTFTRSTVIDGPSINWNGNEIPESLRTVVNHCIQKGAYKAFRGNTAGHFAVKVNDSTFLTSKRSTNFNNLDTIGLVKIESTNKDEVIAYGAKPSVGGQSQRIIFAEHEDVDCIVHFHCPLKTEFRNTFPKRDQYPYECGSHECGQNTSDGLALMGTDGNYPIKAVYLDEHGPNIVFNHNINPENVITFIDHYFDLSQKTGGVVELCH